jgi:hypothetical protein
MQKMRRKRTIKEYYDWWHYRYVCFFLVAAFIFGAAIVSLIMSNALNQSSGASIFISETQRIVVGESLIPEAGNVNVITIHVTNTGAFVLYNVTVQNNVLTSGSKRKRSITIPADVRCAPAYASNVIPVLQPQQTIICRVAYYLTATDIANSVTIESSSSAVGFTDAEITASASSSTSLPLANGVAPEDVVVAIVSPPPPFIVEECGPTSVCNANNANQVVMCNNTFDIYQCIGNSWTFMVSQIGPSGPSGPSGNRGISILSDACTTVNNPTSIPCDASHNLYLLFCNFASDPVYDDQVFICTLLQFHPNILQNHQA